MSDIPSTRAPELAAGNDTIGRLEDEANRKAREFEAGSASLSDKMRETRDAASREGSKLAGQFKDRAVNFAENQKRSGSEKLERLAGAVERAASGLEEEAPQAARYVRSAAKGVQDFSASVRDRKVEDLASEARDFARSRPWLVFGGAVVAGLALTRFLKSSADRSNRSSSNGQASNMYGGRDDLDR